MMRILHINGGVFGGTSRVILDLADGAMEAGYEVDVLTDDPVLGEIATDRGMGVVDMDVIQREIRPLFDFRAVSRLASWLSTNSYDVVQTHTSKGGVIGRLAAHRAGVPAIIHTVHGFAFHEGSRLAERLVYTGVERAAARWCHAIVTVSKHHRDVALEAGIGDRSKVVAIPNGIADIDEVVTNDTDEVRSRMGWSDDERVVFAAGRLSTQKGFSDLIAATPEIVRGSSAPVRVVIAGDGPERDSLASEIYAHAVGDVVELIGFRPDIRELIRAADIVVIPSLWEGLSIFFLEAMSLGSSIVASSIESNLEIDGGEGAALFFPPGESAKLAEAVMAVGEDPAMALEISKRARDRFLGNYLVARTHHSYIDLYRRLTSGRI